MLKKGHSKVICDQGSECIKEVSLPSRQKSCHEDCGGVRPAVLQQRKKGQEAGPDHAGLRDSAWEGPVSPSGREGSFCRSLSGGECGNNHLSGREHAVEEGREPPDSPVVPWATLSPEDI